MRVAVATYQEGIMIPIGGVSVIGNHVDHISRISEMHKEDGLLTINELEDHHCRWLTRDLPDARYCGKHKTVGSYCTEHAALVYASMMVTGHEDAAQTPQKPKVRAHAQVPIWGR